MSLFRPTEKFKKMCEEQTKEAKDGLSRKRKELEDSPFMKDPLALKSDEVQHVLREAQKQLKVRCEDYWRLEEDLRCERLVKQGLISELESIQAEKIVLQKNSDTKPLDTTSVALHANGKLSEELAAQKAFNVGLQEDLKEVRLGVDRIHQITSRLMAGLRDDFPKPSPPAPNIIFKKMDLETVSLRTAVNGWVCKCGEPNAMATFKCKRCKVMREN